VIGADGSYELRDSETPYKADFGLEDEALTQENTSYWGRYLSDRPVSFSPCGRTWRERDTIQMILPLLNRWSGPA
jgi:hypothetical protein